ncbi:MAG TPA: hypothetical protein VG518_03150 [Solirubrobacterales bacterium]|nr:hypothetical protein [Solirubrobacterales bacterium]
MPSFAVSIGLLGLFQAALVAAPGPLPALPLEGLRSRWWALVPAGSIVVVIAIVGLDDDSAQAFSYLALVAVPPLAGLALALVVRGSRPVWALSVVPLFALAWAARSSLLGEGAATALSGLACLALGWPLVALVPERWLRLGVYAMALIDTCLIAADLLQGPNSVLSGAAPGGELPRLQVAHFGSAQMGFGDLFVAALVGCMLAADPRRQRRAAVGVLALALAFDLLFFAVDELPATVPVAVALALASSSGRLRRRRPA